MLNDLTLATFSSLQGARFTVRVDAADIAALELVRVTDRTVRPSSSAHGEGSGATGERFSLLFHGPADRPLTQGTYPFEHGELGTIPLFIVPVGCAGGQLEYEAVFNRMPG